MRRGEGWPRAPFLGQKGSFLACFCQAAHVGLETTPAWAAWSSIGHVRGRSKQARRAPLVGAWALGSEGGSASRKPESGGALGCSFSSVNEGRGRLLAADSDVRPPPGYDPSLRTRRAPCELGFDHERRRRASCLGGLLSNSDVIADSSFVQLKRVVARSTSSKHELALSYAPTFRSW